jgi:Uma2 family endonuclease
MSSTAEDQSLGVMSRNAYRRWAEAQPRGRFERIDGQVVAVAPERASHADRKALAWLALRRAVAEANLPCHVYPDGMTIEAGEDGDYEPDAVVHCGGKLPGDAVVVPAPLIVVEVLSPSTRANDLTRKLVGYFQVPSIRHYLIFDADRPRVIHYRRRNGSQEFDTRILTAGEIRFDPPGMVITVEDVYAT